MVAIDRFGESEVQALKAVDSRLDVVHFRGIPGRAQLDGVEVLFADNLRPEAWLTPSLRWVQLFMAGVDQVPPPPRTTGIAVSSSAGILAGPIAEHAFALLLALIRRLPDTIHAQREHRWLSWRQGEYSPVELEGKTLGILGLGGIGAQIASRGRAFGMNLIAVRRSAQQPGRQTVEVWSGDRLDRIEVMVYPPSGLGDVLAQCHVVVVSLPLTSETRHILSRDQFAAMPRGSFLVNVSRGLAVDTVSMLDALKSGRLAGAGLDVFEHEPLPASSPLWSMPEVIVTPHVAGVTEDIVPRVLKLFIANMARYLAGQPLKNLVAVNNWYAES